MGFVMGFHRGTKNVISIGQFTGFYLVNNTKNKDQALSHSGLANVLHVIRIIIHFHGNLTCLLFIVSWGF